MAWNIKMYSSPCHILYAIVFLRSCFDQGMQNDWNQIGKFRALEHAQYVSCLAVPVLVTYLYWATCAGIPLSVLYGP